MRSSLPAGGLSGIGSQILVPQNGTPLNSSIPTSPVNPIAMNSPMSPRASTAMPYNQPSNITSFNMQQFQRRLQDKVSTIGGNDIESIYDDKSKYKGTVISGMRSGRGEYLFPNDDQYNGQWNNDRFGGIGSYNFSKLGQTYFGEFDNHLMSGNGTLVRNGTQEVIYDGAWQNGLKNGQGTQYYSQSPLEYYEGNWIAGNKQGFGSHFKDGNVYRGQWMNGKKHGKGEYQTREGIVYSGIWNHDTMDSGSIRYPKGDKIFDVYEGQIVNGLRQGTGRYTYSTGQTYEGQYRNDLKDGKGIEKKAGTFYDGTFANDMRQGYGTLIALNGDKFQGQFLEGRKHGPNCSYAWKDGSTFRGSFDNDSMWQGTFIDSKDNIPRTVIKGQVQNV